MVERMAADGIPLTYDEVLAQVPPGATEGRPHIADVLVANGSVPNRDEAFVRGSATTALRRTPLRPGPRRARCASSSRRAGSPCTPIRSGAVVALVWATRSPRRWPPPGSGAGRSTIATTTTRRALMAGSSAGRLGLLVTGSSDYHGAGKENRLGENTTASEVLAEIEARSSGRVPVLR